MDVVVTVPKNFTHPAAPGKKGLAAWIAEGDAAGDPPDDPDEPEFWEFTTYGPRPDIKPGERVYIVCEGRLRGYAPLVELEYDGWRCIFVRQGGAVAVTIAESIVGFRGWRYRWWKREDERTFPEWRETAQPVATDAPLFKEK